MAARATWEIAHSAAARLWHVGRARIDVVAGDPLLGQEDAGRLTGRLTGHVIVVPLDLDQLLAQVRAYLVLGLQLLHLEQLIGQGLALEYESGAELARLIEAAVRLGEMSLEGELGFGG